MKKLGFGCVRLTYHLTYKQALSNLQTAFDAGVTHFDVARLYGFGTAEKIVGAFANDKRDQITITSKFGYYPGNPLMGNLYVQNFARLAFRLLKKLPTRRAVQGAANEIVLHKNFTVADAKRSLEISLRALQTDYIDYYLLHEPTVEEAQNPDIIEFLERHKEKGIIREYGLGSFVDKIENNIGELPGTYSVLQSDCSFPFDFPLDEKWLSSKKVFLFSPFRYYQPCKELLAKDKALVKQLSGLLDIDLNKNLLDLFLLHHIQSPLDSTTLFTSSHNANIKTTIDRWQILQKGKPINQERWQEVKRLLQNKLNITTSSL